MLEGRQGLGRKASESVTLPKQKKTKYQTKLIKLKKKWEQRMEKELHLLGK